MLFTQRLNQNRDFRRLYKSGLHVCLGEAVLYALPNALPCNRLGITAGKKIGNAVTRNRAKRVIRAAYTNAETDLPIGLDIVIVARKGLAEQSSAVLEKALRGRGKKLLERAGARAI